MEYLASKLELSEPGLISPCNVGVGQETRSRARSAIRKQPIIIGINTGGRLGNHLFSLAWMIEMSRLTGATAIYPGFAPYKNWFEAPSYQKVTFWPQTDSIGLKTRLLLLLLHHRTLWLYHHFRITRQWRLDEVKRYLEGIPGFSRRFGYIAFDWLVDGRHADDKLGPTFMLADGQPDYFSDRIQDYVRSKTQLLFDSAAILQRVPLKSVNALREFLRPKGAIREKADNFLASLRAQAEVVIGVAVRQGDFRTWGGGEGFVEPGLFKNQLKSLEGQMSGRRCIFALCSDESISPDQFPEVKAAAVAPGPMNHFATLMGCDYIIGTASSTFIQWASFLGDVPWHPVSPSAANLMPDAAGLKVFGLS